MRKLESILDRINSAELDEKSMRLAEERQKRTYKTEKELRKVRRHLYKSCWYHRQSAPVYKRTKSLS